MNMASKSENTDDSSPHIAVVIPCYREKNHILDVLSSIGPEVSSIFVVDDACPDKTGEFVTQSCTDPRVQVLVNAENQGVGGATLNGYKAAIEAGADIMVKLDGDGQMDPAAISYLVEPIIEHRADYTKGNRLHRRGDMGRMPIVRLLGNMGLTLMSKLSSGYWGIMDPTNGFTAIHADVARELPMDDISTNYFFESDLLFHLSTVDAVVLDMPMRARYGTENSHLVVHKVFLLFLIGHLKNTWRRIVDTYFIREIGIASFELLLGALLLVGGSIFGAYKWWLSVDTGVPATAGTVVLAALPVLIGVQLLLAFIGHDTRRVPSQPLHMRAVDSPATKT